MWRRAPAWRWWSSRCSGFCGRAVEGPRRVKSGRDESRPYGSSGAERARDLRAAVVLVVVRRDAHDLALVDGEENAGGEHVALAVRFRQAGRGMLVDAVHAEFGRGARAVVDAHDDHVAPFLAV